MGCGGVWRRGVGVGGMRVCRGVCGRVCVWGWVCEGVVVCVCVCVLEGCEGIKRGGENQLDYAKNAKRIL